MPSSVSAIIFLNFAKLLSNMALASSAA
jgi:hypothetical protein